MIAQAIKEINPHARLITPHVMQITEADLTTPHIFDTPPPAKPQPARRDVLAAQKLAGRSFLHIHGCPGAWNVSGGEDSYTLLCAERLGEMMPFSCNCPARGECSHMDALTKALAYRPERGVLQSVTPAQDVVCRMCGGPVCKIVQFGKATWFDVVCVQHVMGGDCKWRII